MSDVEIAFSRPLMDKTTPVLAYVPKHTNLSQCTQL